MFHEMNVAIKDALSLVFTHIGNFLPRIIGALIIVIIGWIAGLLVGIIIERVFKAIGLQALFEKIRLEALVKKAGATHDTSTLLGALGKWIIWIIALIAGLVMIEISEISGFSEQLVAYIPQVVTAGAILFFGIIIANYLAALIEGVIKAASLKFGGAIALFIKYTILIFAFLVALEKLGVASYLVQTLFTGFVAFLAVGGGLAFGLGGQNVAREIVEKVKKTTE
jgi:hypothetical protein